MVEYEQQLQSIVLKYWQEALLEIHNHQVELAFPKHDQQKSGIDFNKNTATHNKNFIAFGRKTGLVEGVKLWMNRHNIKITDKSELQFIKLATTILIGKMNEWGYIKELDDRFDAEVVYDTYVITEKGIDIALKLQQHEDNKSHNGEIRKLQRIVITIALVSLIFTFIAA